ncbi:hypothetical protein Scep_017106 [Stephania cephalantha]|uniref:non-specific serine/threonine protein kinase n=1 Tax=Stephania cephalantha TaxID=152367 RepID=A0AAP0IQA2_9MAGN
MPEEETDLSLLIILPLLLLITGQIVSGSSIETDKEVLLQLKSYLIDQNKVNPGRYSAWNDSSSSPCDWPEITCAGERVTGINLSNCNLSGNISGFHNFSQLAQLDSLDFSQNTIGGEIPTDLSRCSNLKYLNLSQNLIEGELNLTGLNNLEVLDLTVNRLRGEIQWNFPAICNRLVTLNISANYFTGRIDNCFDECRALQDLDLSSNNFTGKLWSGLSMLRHFSVSENNLTGQVSPSIFTENCSLEAIDLSGNHFEGEVPNSVTNCRSLIYLSLWGNNFSGHVPADIGLLSSLEILILGSNNFSREIPVSLLDCSKLTFLDLSKNNFGEDIQEIFGKFNQVRFLVLHGNSYKGGIHTSGILKLANVRRLDLSFNNFSGPLPIEFSKMLSLEFLILAYNQFTGDIPLEFGNFPRLQALDLSHNKLTGSIPPTIGKLNSLLWLMLAGNALTGKIPPEIGNCGSLLWLNLANNKLTGRIPSQLPNMGRNVTLTFEKNRNGKDIPAGSGECLTMKRWLPADYPPFSFVYDLLTRKRCRTIWGQLVKGYGIIPICVGNSTVRTQQISGYIQLTGNELSGEIPHEIGQMQNFSLLHLSVNRFSGKLPAEIVRMPLVSLNVSSNIFSGEIPFELGHVKCLQILDLSLNNFSGVFPPSFNNLNDLSKFNISYNPSITGVVPMTGQLATFERESFLGDPLLKVPSLENDTNTSSSSSIVPNRKGKRPTNLPVFLVFLVLTSALFVCGSLSFTACAITRHPRHPEFLLQDTKYRHDMELSSSIGSSPLTSDTVKIISLDKKAFTYADILKATGNFSEENIIGKGGYGTVYRGKLPDGREVAVKKLQRDGIEGEREFLTEMEVLSGSGGSGWPHPNLVPLYGWCLYKSEKLLVYEFMEGGSLEDFVSDRVRLNWQRRIDVAIGIARALLFLHHECYPPVVHRDVKASNVLLDGEGRPHVTDFGLARVVGIGESHVSTIVAGTIGYVAPEYGTTWQATTKGDVYSFGVLAMELATGRRAVDGGEECLLEWARRVVGNRREGLSKSCPVLLLGFSIGDGAEQMCELLKVGLWCTAEAPQARPNMKEVLARLIKISHGSGETGHQSSSPT